MAGTSRCLFEVRVRPRPAAKFPTDHPQNHSCKHDRGELLQSLGRAAHRKLAAGEPTWLAKHGFAPLSIGRATEHFEWHPNEGNDGGQRIAKRCFAATCVPAVHPFCRKSNPSDALRPPIVHDRIRWELHDVGTGVRIKEVGATEIVQERLAIITITDCTIDQIRCDASGPPMD